MVQTGKDIQQLAFPCTLQRFVELLNPAGPSGASPVHLNTFGNRCTMNRELDGVWKDG